MADTSTSDIAGYASYLKAQGVSDGDIHGYTKYLADQHGVDHPSDVSSQASDKSPDQTMKANASRLNDAGDTTNESLMNSLLAGHYPQVKAKLGQIFSGEGMSNDQNYVNRRDQAISDMNARNEKYPAAHIQGEVGGAVLPMLATGGGSAAEEIPAALAAKQGLAQAIAKGAVKGAAVGGAMGLAQNPGDTAGEVNPVQLNQRLENAKTGAEFGAAIGGPLGAIPNVAEYLSGSAEKKALKGAGAMLKDFRKEHANDSIEQTGRFILDNKLVGPGDTYESTAAKASNLRDATGEELGKGYDAAVKIVDRLGPKARAEVDGAGFNPVRDKDAILSAAKQELGYSYGRKGALKSLSNYLDELGEEHGNKTLNPRDANEVKTALDKSAINWERNPLTRDPDAETALKSFRKYLSTQIEGQIGTIGDLIGNPKAAENLSALNEKYGMASKVSRIAGDKAQRDAANASFGLKEYAGAEIGGEIGEAVMGKPGRIIGTVGGMAVGHVGRKLGPSLSASATDAAANALAKAGSPGAIAQANPAVYSAIASKNNSGNFEAKPSSPDVPPPAKVPEKGPEKWAQDGLQKLIDHSGDKSLDKSLLKNPKAKQLLIAASDLKVGTPAMDKLLSKIKSLGKDE